MAKNKMEDVYDDMLGSKPKSIKGNPRDEIKSDIGSFIRVNFFISKNQKEKLKEYTRKIAPAHIKVSQSELIRYMIENFDSEEAKENFFKVKD